MRRYKLHNLWLPVAMVSVVLLTGVPLAEDIPQPEHTFIGVKKCSMCHRSEKTGGQLQAWEASRHAGAYETLGTPEAKELGAHLGVAEPQSSGKCLKCHSTAYWFSEERVSMDIPVEEGVSCESCHGPGKDYMSMSVMKDHDKAIAAGLYMPDARTCIRCHNTQAPNPVDFDFESFWKKIAHPIPE